MLWGIALDRKRLSITVLFLIAPADAGSLFAILPGTRQGTDRDGR